MVDNIARSAIGDDEFEVRQRLQHLAWEPRSLLGDRDDLVLRELFGKPLGRNGFAVEGDVGSVAERGPVAELFRDTDVVV
jgi:hypothetical protein